MSITTNVTTFLNSRFKKLVVAMFNHLEGNYGREFVHVCMMFPITSTLVNKSSIILSKNNKGYALNTL